MNLVSAQSMGVWLATVAILVGAAPAAGQFTVTPLDERGADGVPDAVVVESPFYKLRFILWEAGAADSLAYRPLSHEFRAEDYYGNHLTMFRDWVRLADPDPIEGHTRNIGDAEIREQSRAVASYRVIRQDANELVLEFETRGLTAGGQPWMEQLVKRRRVLLRNNTPAIRVENEILNQDAVEHSVLFDVFNGLGLGRVKTCVSLPGPEGKLNGVDVAEETSSSYIFAPEVAGAWLGGVNEQGLGAAFSFAWPDVDAMQVCMYKTVGAAYHAVLRRRTVPAGGSLTFAYAFLPFTGFGTLDGMTDDLAGGVLVGAKANYLEDVAAAELKPAAVVPIRLTLASGTPRSLQVRLRCVHQEDGQTVLDETRPVAVKVAETATLAGEVKLAGAGLYVLTVTAEGDGASLRMEKPLEVGQTKLAYHATLPSGEKRGTRDGGLGLGPAKMNPQFKTLDRSFVTPHLPLLKDHAQGPVQAFFLTPADSTLGHVREICQRADIVSDYFAITKVRLPKYELHPTELNEFRDQLRQAGPQVLVTLGIDWNIGLKRKLAAELLDRVRAGMGVVVAARALDKQAELQAAMAEGQEVAWLPASAVAIPVPKPRCFQVGRGRLVIIPCDWVDTRDEGRFALGSWTTLHVAGRAEAIAELRWRGFEYGYARLGDLIRWAAGRESPVAVLAATLQGATAAVTVRNAAGPLTAELSVSCRTRRWETRAVGKTPVQLPAGESRHELQLSSAGESGPCALEIHLRDAAGKVLAFGSAGVKGESPVTLRVTPQPLSQRADQPGRCEVEVSGKLDRGRLVVDVLDRFGRLVFRESRDIRSPGGAIREAVSLESIRPLCVYHEVVARVFSAEQPERWLAEQSADLYLLPSRPPYADRYLLGVWGAPERDVLLMQAGLDTTHSLGLTLHSHCYDDRLLYATGGFKTAAVNLSVQQRYARRGEAAKLDSEHLIMNPPLLPSPEAVAAAKADWQTQARRQYESGAWMLGLDDERRMSDDFDFHPQTLDGFRRWLAGRHADIAALNKSWGSRFADFSQVVPQRRKELGDSANLAPWLEFRIFIGEVLGDFYMRAPAQWAEEISPDLAVCEWGIYEPSVTWPVDWRRYAAAYKVTTRYGGNQGVLEELIRSFAPQTRHGLWMGYGMMSADAGRRIDPWRSLLNGGVFSFFWEMRDPGSLNYAVLTSDQRPTAGYAVLGQEEFPDLTGGIDRLILASRFTDDKIAVAYSYPSWLADTSALAGRAKVIVEELGFQHTFVDLDDVTAGRLEKEGYKLLVIQQASCLSRPQIDALRHFVEQGGVLVCVGRIGWRDLHGGLQPEGALGDALSGVRTARASPLGRVMPIGEAPKPGALFVAEKDVETGEATVLATAELDGRKLPVWTVRPLGRGKVFWLNSTLDAHRTVHTGGVAGERSVAVGGPEAVRQTHWDLFDRMLAEAGISPRLRLLDGNAPLFDTETWYYQTPSGRSLLVAHYLAQKSSGPLTLRFDRKSHVYEVRARKYLGESASIQDTLPAGRMKLYALLDYRVQGVSVSLAAPRSKPGAEVQVQCSIQTDGKPADLHAFDVRLLAPNGQSLPGYQTIQLAPDGQATLRWPLALNHPPGKYTVRATDVVTGCTAEAQFDVAE